MSDGSEYNRRLCLVGHWKHVRVSEHDVTMSLTFTLQDNVTTLPLLCHE